MGCGGGPHDRLLAGLSFRAEQGSEVCCCCCLCCCCGFRWRVSAAVTFACPSAAAAGLALRPPPPPPGADSAPHRLSSVPRVARPGDGPLRRPRVLLFPLCMPVSVRVQVAAADEGSYLPPPAHPSAAGGGRQFLASAARLLLWQPVQSPADFAVPPARCRPSAAAAQPRPPSAAAPSGAAPAHAHPRPAASCALTPTRPTTVLARAPAPAPPDPIARAVDAETRFLAETVRSRCPASKVDLPTRLPDGRALARYPRS
mmetsp:Transcript_97409/g.175940  ORF Transcript_97409/g.175940 Transcript_97409/m.175940 type:complete len:258 (-) Transcript_97409:757-1530(-)